MEVKLDSLIDQIKKEGVEQADKRAAEIIANAQQQADERLEEAKREAENIIAKGRQQAEKFQKNGEAALQQAARDITLVVRQRLQELLDKTFKQGVSDTVSGDFLKEMVLKLCEHWNKEGKLEVLVSADDKKALQEQLFSRLKSSLKDSVFIRIDPRIQKGVRVGLEGENVHYDFTDQGIVEFLKQFINPALARILDAANG